MLQSFADRQAEDDGVRAGAEGFLFRSEDGRRSAGPRLGPGDEKRPSEEIDAARRKHRRAIRIWTRYTRGWEAMEAMLADSYGL